MSQPTRTGMRAAAVLGVFLLSLLLAACGGGAAPAPTTVAQAPTEAPPPPTEAPPTKTPPTLAPTDTPAPTEAPTKEPTPTDVPVVDATNCVTCHTDETLLQTLAVEPEVEEALSEGEG